MISAIVFVFWKDEVDLIDACLASLSWVDEIVVIDNGASEEILAKVKKYTKNVYKDESLDFSHHHNLGKDKAKGDWLLYVDADERISKTLGKEIEETVLSSSECTAYRLRRVNFFLGKQVLYGDRFPDYVTRLFRKSNLKEWTGRIHESSIVSGRVGDLSSPLFHLTHRNIFSMLEKTINFAEHEAQLRLAANHPKVVWWRLIRVFLTEFYMRIIKYQGFRQGTEGWIDGIFQAFSLFIVYARLWELQTKPTLFEKYQKIDKDILEGKI